MNKTILPIMSLNIIAVALLDALLVEQAIAYQTVGYGLNPLVALTIGAVFTVATILLVVKCFGGAK